MGEYSSHHLEINTYIVELPKIFLESLGAMRHWENILMATEEKTIWLKGFTKEQIYSVEVKIIPEVVIYELKNKQLFILGNAVPEKKLPTGLLWTEIRKLLTVEIPKNWQTPFEVEHKIEIKIVEDHQENESTWVEYDYDLVEKIIAQEPNFRFQNLNWVIINKKALVKGNPALGIPGQSFWEADGHIFPAGYNFQFPILRKSIYNKLSPERDFYLFWTKTSEFIKIKKDSLRALSRSSVKLSKNLL
jgi:hypothetical protein